MLSRKQLPTVACVNRCNIKETETLSPMYAIFIHFPLPFLGKGMHSTHDIASLTLTVRKKANRTDFYTLPVEPVVASLSDHITLALFDP